MGRFLLLCSVAALALCAPAAAQTTPKVGLTFGAELQAAGCPNGVLWSADGALAVAPGVDPACATRVLAAHDPTKRPARAVEVSELLDALSAAQRASITVDHMGRLVARAAKGPVTAADSKVVRAAADLGMTPDAWVALVPAAN